LAFTRKCSMALPSDPNLNERGPIVLFGGIPYPYVLRLFGP
jgi:hypothetical protein